ncbi:putative mediator of RNA polymerase II transcription subunit 37b [Platanthera guangdongensis]|uniref:Mediator of RNA polymerase II transcription subunit 37b n=1 Tax=Platanthera guangdongensis TaxID=2320717 RepID=A0ABR2MXW3_9ASPA
MPGCSAASAPSIKIFPDGIPRYPIIRNNQTFFLTELEILASLFASLKSSTEIIFGRALDNAIAVVPATLKHRYSTFISAAASAGFQSFLVVERPVIAAFRYQYLSPPKTYLVFELDSDILEISLLVPFLRVKSSVAYLGCPLLNTMVQETLHRTGIDICANSDALFSLGKACELAKSAFCSGTGSGVLKFQRRDKRLLRQISSKEVVEMNLRALRDGIGKCLREGGVLKEDVDEVILAGVSTYIPEVRQVLREFFEWKPLRCDIDPVNLIGSGARRLANLTSAGFDRPFFPIVHISNAGDFYF